MPMRYEVEIKGLDEQIAKLGRLNSIGRKHFRTAMGRSVLKLVSSIKPVTPVDTGRLRGSIRGRVRMIGTQEIHGIVSSNMSYAGYVEFGTKKMRPRRYMARGFRMARETIKRYFKLALQRTINAMKVRT